MKRAKWISLISCLALLVISAGCTDGIASRLRARGVRGETAPNLAKPEPFPTLAIQSPSPTPVPPANPVSVPPQNLGTKNENDLPGNPLAGLPTATRPPLIEGATFKTTNPVAPPLTTEPRSEPKKTQAADTSNPLRTLHQRAAAQYASMDSYMMQFRRREVVGNQSRPEETILLKFRRNPWSVYLKWIGNEGKGREATFSKNKYGNQIHTLTAAGDVPFMPAGYYMKISPENILVKSNTRYPITEAGISGMIDRFGSLVSALERGDTSQGTAKYLGQVKREEFANPVEAVHHVLPVKSDPLLPRGGQRWWFFDASSHGLPVLMIAKDENGREVEYYCHDRFIFPARLDDDDFDPTKLFAKR